MLKGWLGKAFDYVNGYDLPLIYEPRSPISKMIIRDCRVGSRSQKKLMGRLASEEKVTPEKFQRYMEHLARGIDYIHDRLGTHIDSVSIPDEDRGIYVHHDHDTKEITLMIPLKEIEEIAANYGKPDKTCHQSKTEPHRITHEDMTTLYGVEEAYHAYQLRFHYDRYKDTLLSEKDFQDGKRPDNYGELPIEKDAEVIVRQAATHFKFWTDAPKQAMDNAQTTKVRKHKP